MSKRRTPASVAAIAAATVMTACSSNGTSAQNTSADKPTVNKDNWPAKVPQQGLAKNLVLPLEKYMLFYDDRVTLDQATTDLQQKCMTDYGFHLTLPRAGEDPPSSTDDANMERRYGITNPYEAAKYGYEPALKFRGHTSQSVPDLPGVQVEVLTGQAKGHKNLADPRQEMPQGVTEGRSSKSQESIELAVDDVACKERDNLVKVWFDAESKIENN